MEKNNQRTFLDANIKQNSNPNTPHFRTYQSYQCRRLHQLYRASPRALQERCYQKYGQQSIYHLQPLVIAPLWTWQIKKFFNNNFPLDLVEK